jgi:hypothetical protein
MSILDAIKNQYEKNKAPEQKSFEQDFSKYFTPNLEDGVENGEKTIRILPPVEKNGSPFDEAYWHVIDVGGKYKKLYCKEKNDKGHCPLCETAKDLRAAGDEDSKKLAKTYEPKKFYITRVIDREKEEDGIKFWRFPHNWKNEGVLDKIVPIFTKKGDITDPREGRDLTVIMSKDYSLNKKGFTKVTSIMADDVSLLTDPKGEKAKLWMGDKTTWRDIYKAQPEEYVKIIADGETPIWDKNLEKFVPESQVSANTETSMNKLTNAVSSPQPSGDEDEEPF